MHDVAGRASNVVGLVLPSVPARALAALVAFQAGVILSPGLRLAVTENHVDGKRLVAQVIFAGAVAGLASRCARVAADTMLGLIDRQDRL